MAVGNDPKNYAVHAEQFIGLKPIYVRRTLEGLQSVAGNPKPFEWGGVLKLIEFTYSQYGRVVDPAILADGDDKDWRWACMTASELLAAGLRGGAGGIGFEHAPLVSSLVFMVLGMAPKHPRD